MNRIDVVLAVFVALFALRGLWRGFARELFALVGLVGGVVVAADAYARAAEALPPEVPEIIRPALGFVAVFLAVYVLAKIAGALVSRALGIVALSPLNRAAGALFGAVKGCALVALAMIAARSVVPPATIERLSADSVVMQELLRFSETSDAALSRGLPDPAATPAAGG